MHEASRRAWRSVRLTAAGARLDAGDLFAGDALTTRGNDLLDRAGLAFDPVARQALGDGSLRATSVCSGHAG